MYDQIRVLVVDDEERFRNNLVRLLQTHDIVAAGASGGEEALQELARQDFDVVLLDMKMPGLSGKETMRQIKERGFKVKTIVLTGHASVDDAMELLGMGAMDYLLKPCKTEALLEMIHLAKKDSALQG